MAVLSRRWPFYQGRSSQVARHPDFGRGLQSPYYPAQSVYQRPGQAIFSKSRPNCRFINARPNGRFIKAEATGWPDLQISATNCNFGIIPHNQFISGRTKLFSAKAGPMAVLSTRSPMAVLSKQKQPDGQTSRFQRQIAILVLSRTTKLFSAKAGPIAVLSTRGPMAVLSKQKQPGGQTSRFQRQIVFSVISRTISLSAAKVVSW